MDPNPELTHLYSCSRWANLDPNEVIANYVQIGEETCKQLRKTIHVEDLPYDQSDDPNSPTKVDIWGEVKDDLVIFIHGGYWQEGTRKVVSPVAVNLLKRGIAMAALGYEYASPSNPISQVVKQLVAATEFLLSKHPQAKRITLAGHSAGAQLAFKVATCLQHPRIQKLALFAGVFDLSELPFCEIGTAIGLTPEEAKKSSCHACEINTVNIRVQILIALKPLSSTEYVSYGVLRDFVGRRVHQMTEKDSPKLIEQNRAMVKAMKSLGIALDAHEFVNCDHFDIVQGLRENSEEQTQKFLAFLCDDKVPS